MRNRKKESNGSVKPPTSDAQKKEKLSTEAKAVKLKEILARAASRSNEEAQEAAEEQSVRDRLDARGNAAENNDEEEKDLLEKIQRTYEKYLAKK